MTASGHLARLALGATRPSTGLRPRPTALFEPPTAVHVDAGATDEVLARPPAVDPPAEGAARRPSDDTFVVAAGDTAPRPATAVAPRERSIDLRLATRDREHVDAPEPPGAPPRRPHEPAVAGPGVAGPGVDGPAVAGPAVAGPAIGGPTVAGPSPAADGNLRPTWAAGVDTAGDAATEAPTARGSPDIAVAAAPAAVPRLHPQPPHPSQDGRPEITVTIGRIDVSPVAPERPVEQRPRQRRPATAPDLADYVRRRSRP